MDRTQIETITHLSQESPEPITGTEPVFSLSAQPESKIPKADVRRSLRASTLDGVFAAIFTNVTTGVLLSNFLVELNATPVQIGLSASIPMVVNLIQPLGAFLGDRTRSLHYYCLGVCAPSRLVWLVLLGCIAAFQAGQITEQTLVVLTLGILFVNHLSAALGSASWLFWLAALVPRRLRGRYFSIRNSAANLTFLICVPIAGMIVSAYPGGPIGGYSAIVLAGIVAGMISLCFQWGMTDINPQEHKLAALQAKNGQSTQLNGLKSEGQQLIKVQAEDCDRDFSLVMPTAASIHDSEGSPTDVSTVASTVASPGISSPIATLLRDANFLRFLIYFSIWMFAVNLSAPFFNLYMLDTLALDVRWVTIYNSLTAGANLLMLMVWGKLADRLGNRFLLITVGFLVAITPILWLGTSNDLLSIWVWLPLLHVLAGGTWAAIDLCNNNIQLAIAPVQSQPTYFAVAAAIAGVSGALGTTAGGFLAQFSGAGGLLGLFALSTIVRLLALLPLAFVQEAGRQLVHQVLKVWWVTKSDSGIEGF